MKHNIESLPKWAQKIIREQSEENDHLAVKISNLRKITSRLDEGKGEWYTFFHPKLSDREGYTNLFILNRNSADCIGSLGENDFIMVCRSTKT